MDNFYTYYNCGLNGYISELARVVNKPNWKVHIITISAGRFSYHPIDEYLRNDLEQETFNPKAKGNLFDVVFYKPHPLNRLIRKIGPMFHLRNT